MEECQHSGVISKHWSITIRNIFKDGRYFLRTSDSIKNRLDNGETKGFKRRQPPIIFYLDSSQYVIITPTGVRPGNNMGAVWEGSIGKPCRE